MASILLVEDDPMISEIYQRKLSQSGYEVVLAFDGRDAVNKIQSQRYDLVLLDLVLPVLDGISVLKEISREGKQKSRSPIVVFSNLNDGENQEAAFRYGAQGFIAKAQFNPSELIGEVQRYLRESSEQKKNEDKFNKSPQEENSEDEEKEKKHILLVEDEDVFSHLFSERLRKEGFKVTVAENGLEALTFLEKEAIDIIITDILLPIMRGDELITRIRLQGGEKKDIPIVVVSASAKDEQVALVKNMNIQGFFVKTRIIPSELAQYIYSILEGNKKENKNHKDTTTDNNV